MIPHFELQRSPSVINITLLPTMSCTYPFSNDEYLVASVLNQLWPQRLSLINVVPIQGQLTLPSIQCFVMQHSNSRLVVVVVGELVQR